MSIPWRYLALWSSLNAFSTLETKRKHQANRPHKRINIAKWFTSDFPLAANWLILRPLWPIFQHSLTFPWRHIKAHVYSRQGDPLSGLASSEHPAEVWRPRQDPCWASAFAGHDEVWQRASRACRRSPLNSNFNTKLLTSSCSFYYASADQEDLHSCRFRWWIILLK